MIGPAHSYQTWCALEMHQKRDSLESFFGVVPTGPGVSLSRRAFGQLIEQCISQDVLSPGDNSLSLGDTATDRHAGPSSCPNEDPEPELSEGQWKIKMSNYSRKLPGEILVEGTKKSPTK